ncbi:MAG: hypothetical protein IAF38_02605, partial [Bacteroidia bacterium]|nr:hypothetical protein [Bacteroidia bacterium]
TFEFEDEIAANIELDSIKRDFLLKGWESYGPGILLSGYIDVAEDAGDSATIVVYITKEYDENEAIPSTDPNFSDLNGSLVCYTSNLSLKVFLDAHGQYYVFFPNKIIEASGEKTVLAIPILYMDGVDVAQGEAKVINIE